MLTYPTIDPIAFHLGPIAVHWYGIMYLLGFGLAWVLALHRAKLTPDQWQKKTVEDLIFYCAVGVIIGGRVGYMLFYDTHILLSKPWMLFEVWQGGMSFHGGLLGVTIALICFARRQGMSFLSVADFVVPLVPIGLCLGRVGNFINGELWGRVSSAPWAMMFPTGGPFPRHPSQLYECFFEGVVLFTVLWLYSRQARPKGAVSAWFLILYGVFRFSLEFFRQPDPQLGFVFCHWMTMGQLLSLPMIIAGIILWVIAHRTSST
ncbi:MAG: prolipoprotein diacylglyceryl transferase [marine bacterium B5-7]|nr:MAG: prolipoprotein diacylglyceryl transferase [marine bacterium B5-7]